MNHEKTATEKQDILYALENLTYQISWLDVRTREDAEIKEILMTLVGLVRRLQ